MSFLLVVAAAGSGSRLGREEPKALVSLRGRPMLDWVLEAMEGISFGRIVVAVPPGKKSAFERILRGRATLVDGGQTRAASVRAAFHALGSATDDIVCIHDAARPFVTAEETSRVLAAAQSAGAAIAVSPIVDTVKRVESGRVTGTLDRATLFAAGTPQAFRADLLSRLLADGRESTDEAALFEAAGLCVEAVAVSRLGFKITHPEDLEIAEAILDSRAGMASPPGSKPSGGTRRA